MVTVQIPSTVRIEGYDFKVTTIAAKAFQNKKKLKKVTIGKNVVSIGSKAFNGCKMLKTIVVKSKNLKKVGKAGHPGGSLSAADAFTYLYFVEMNIDPRDLGKADRDRFVLPKGHTAPGLSGYIRF